MIHFDEVVTAKMKVTKAASNLSHFQHKEKFLKKYAVQMEMPANYVFCAQVCRKDPNTIAMAVKQTFPSDLEFYDIDKLNSSENQTDDIYQHFAMEESQSIVFKVLQLNDGQYKWLNQRQANPLEYSKCIVASLGEGGTRTGLVRSYYETVKLPSGTTTQKEHHEIDIFDCSTNKFWSDTSLISKDDRYHLYSIYDSTLSENLHNSNVEIRFSKNSKYLYIILNKTCLKVYELKLDPSSEGKLITQPSFEFKTLSIFEYMMKVAIREDSLMNSQVAFRRKGAPFIDVVTFDWIQGFLETSKASPGKMTKNMILELNYKYGAKALALQSSNCYDPITVFSQNLEYLIHSSNGKTYLLNLGDSTESPRQKVVKHLEGKYARYITPYGKDDFIIVTSPSLSQRIAIRSAQDSAVKHKIDTKYVQNAARIQDLILLENGCIRTILSRNDEEFRIFDLAREPNTILRHKFQLCSLYSFEWPYICYLKGSNEIIIQNAFAVKIAFFLRLNLEETGSHVSHLILSQDYILYYAIQNSTGYELYCQDLKIIEPLIVRTGTTGEQQPKIGALTSRFAKQLLTGKLRTPICKISMDELDHQQIYKFYVRELEREGLGINQERVILIRFNYKVFHWYKGELKFIDDCHRFRTITSDIGLYLNPKTKTRKTNQIKMIKFNYTEYTNSLLHEEVEGVVQDFLVGDYVLVLLIKGQGSQKDGRVLKIFDVNQKMQAKVRCTIAVEDKDFIRSFISSEASASSFVCQQNKVYFVITSFGRPTVHSYSQVIPLEEGERILSNSPIVNYSYKRMMYCKANYKTLTTKKCIIIPFINDNYVMFNNKEMEISYNNFFEYRDSSSPTRKKQVILTVYPSIQRALLYNLKGQLKENVKLEEIYKELGEDILCVSPNAHIFAHLHNDGMEYEIISLLSITVKSKQISRETFGQMAEMQLRAPTNIVRKGKSIIGEATQKNKPYISVLPIENIEMNKIPLQEEHFLSLKKKNAFDIIQHYEQKQCEIKIKMNNSLDLAIGFVYTKNEGFNIGPAFQKQQSYLKDLMILKLVGKSRSAFFVRITSEFSQQMEESEEQIGRKNIQESLLLRLKQSRSQNEDVAFSKQNYLLDCYDYLILTDYIIVWSDSCIYYADIRYVNSNTSTITLQKVRFEIPHPKVSGEKANIVSVQSQGPIAEDFRSQKIFIMIKINIDSEYIFVKYNLLQEIEECSHECSSIAQCFYNPQGEVYIIDRKFIMATGSGIPLYQYKVNLGEFECSNIFTEQFEKGYRFCSSFNNTKFMVKNKFYLPYNYHTLILMNERSGMELTLENFDPSAIFKYNGDTALHMYASSYQQLKFILEQYEKSNPDLINMLFMKNNQEKTVLKLAIEQQNAKCVNLILSKISLLSVNNIQSVKKDIDKLMTYDGFEGYLQLCFFKTSQMKHKKALKMVEFDSDCPFVIQASRTSYLDKEFYEKFCTNGEESEVASRAVNINAIDAEWILKEEQGQRFLMTLAETDNVRYFDIFMIRVLIYYLWEKMRPKIQLCLFIPFLINFGLFNYFVLLTFEKSRALYDPELYPTMDEEEFNRWMKSYDILNLMIMGILFIFALFTITIEFKQLMFHREKYFTSFWNALDCIAAWLVPIILILVATHWVQDTQIRPLNAIALLIFYLRFFYFLRIFDASAHYVRIIVEIIADIKIFMMVLFMGIAGFAFAFYVLSMNNSPHDQFIDSLAGSILYSYLLAVGEFNLDMYSVSTNELLLWVLFSLASLFTLIMLLNMLIAIMGESYSRVTEQAESEKFRDRLQLILENDFLFFNKQKLFQDVKYLIAIEQDKDIFQKNLLEKKLDVLKSTQDDGFREIQTQLLDISKHFDLQLKTLFKNMEGKFSNQEENKGNIQS